MPGGKLIMARSPYYMALAISCGQFNPAHEQQIHQSSRVRPKVTLAIFQLPYWNLNGRSSSLHFHFSPEVLLSTYAIPVTYKHATNRESCFFITSNIAGCHTSNSGFVLINTVHVIQASILFSLAMDRHAHGKIHSFSPSLIKNRLLVAIMLSLCEFACLWYKGMTWQCKRKCNI